MEVLFGKNKEECPDPIKADVQGEIPEWLQGLLIRNGPGMHIIGNSTYNHWFDGMALLHSFHFKNGEVFYRSKYLRSDTYITNMQEKRIVVSEFGTMAYPDPCKNIFSKAATFLANTIPEFTDNCLINIMKCGEDFYATSETNFIRRIDPGTLDTMEKIDYSKYVAVNLATSHPHYDSAGNVYNMGTSIAEKGKTKYLIIKIPSTIPEGGKKKSCFKYMEVMCSIPSRWLLNACYYHSFGMTENYIIFVEQPFKLDLLRLATAYMRGVNWASCLEFNPEDKTLIYVVDRKTKKIIPGKFYTDALVTFHHVNAYEEDGHVVFDIIAYEDNSLYEMFYLANIKHPEVFEDKSRDKSRPTCRRFVIPLQHDKEAAVGTNFVTLASTTATALKEKDGHIYCTPEMLATGIELPRINYGYNGKKYRYIYAADVDWKPIPTKIMKFDIQTKDKLTWEEDHCWPAEPVFVAAPNGKEEDDGVLLSSVVTSDPKKPPFMLVLDAKTFKEVARASVKADIFLDLHGFFVSEADLPKKVE